MSITTKTAWSRENIASSREETVKKGFEVYTTVESCEKRGFSCRSTATGQCTDMKPVDLVSHMLKKQQPERRQSSGRLRGSGTTLIYCEKYGRHGYIMEYDPEYADVIVRRWQTYTSKQATHEAAGRLLI